MSNHLLYRAVTKAIESVCLTPRVRLLAELVCLSLRIMYNLIRNVVKLHRMLNCIMIECVYLGQCGPEVCLGPCQIPLLLCIVYKTIKALFSPASDSRALCASSEGVSPSDGPERVQGGRHLPQLPGGYK